MLLALTLLLAVADTLPGRVVERTFASEQGSLEFRLFLPSAPPPAAGHPLLVMLHGCTQSAADFAAGTRADSLAERLGVVVVYPQQPPAAHPLRCWNWYLPAHQRGGAGEPALIRGIVREVMRERAIDSTRVWAAGISAGGVMAVTLAAAYPEVFKAVAVHSGVPHRAATDAAGGLRVMRAPLPVDSVPPLPSPPGGRLPRALLIHGAADPVVHPGNLDGLLHQWLRAAREAGAPLTEAPGDASRRRFRDAAGRLVVQHWLLPGVGHAWSGGSPAGSYTDAAGPDATREIFQFLLHGDG